jgi:hypothetical protein
MNRDYLEDIQIDDLNAKDYPDFCDAYISYATYRGATLSDEELNMINEDRDFVYEVIMTKIY